MRAPHLSVTPAAERFMRRMVRFSGQPGGGFRLSVAPGGCAGLTAQFSVEPAPAAGDAELTVNGLRVFLAAESRPLLDGVTVDFAETATHAGLTVVSPDAAACGCTTAGDPRPPAHATVTLSSIRRL